MSEHSKRKSVGHMISHLYDGYSHAYEIAEHFGFVQFYRTGTHYNKETHTYEPYKEPTHSVAFTEDEQAHLKRNKGITIVHACGFEWHIKNPV